MSKVVGCMWPYCANCERGCRAAKNERRLEAALIAAGLVILCAASFLLGRIVEARSWLEIVR